MDAERVDFAGLPRSLASAASRRGLLAGLTRSLLAGIPLGLVRPMAGAKTGYRSLVVLTDLPTGRLTTDDSRLQTRLSKGHPNGCSSP